LGRLRSSEFDAGVREPDQEIDRPRLKADRRVPLVREHAGTGVERLRFQFLAVDEISVPLGARRGVSRKWVDHHPGSALHSAHVRVLIQFADQLRAAWKAPRVPTSSFIPF